MEHKIVWDKECEKTLDNIMSVIKQEIINLAENFARISDVSTIRFTFLESAFHKAISNLNKINHILMIENFGPEKGMFLINSLETSTDVDISRMIIEEIKNSEKITPEIQKIIEDFMRNNGL
jgi:hypothetical protein